jgi:hypothetical protein
MASRLATSPAAPELAQLRDIHLPAPIGWWPPAAGWYLLTLIIVVMLFAAIFFIRRHYINGRAKRHALRLLASYQQQYQQDHNSQLCAARVSELLKRVALVYFPRSNVASLQGDEWILFLTNTSKGLRFETVRTALLDIPYQPTASHDLSSLLKFVRTWISQRRGRCLN